MHAEQPSGVGWLAAVVGHYRATPQQKGRSQVQHRGRAKDGEEPHEARTSRMARREAAWAALGRLKHEFRIHEYTHMLHNYG